MLRKRKKAMKVEAQLAYFFLFILNKDLEELTISALASKVRMPKIFGSALRMLTCTVWALANLAGFFWRWCPFL
jgi:hypothetical protein